MRKNRSSPRIHCGWLWEERYEGFTEKERQREVTNKKRRREEGEQQFDSRLVSSLIIYFTEVFCCFFLQMSSFRTFWDPRRTLASGSHRSQTWGNPQRCSCQEP